MTHQRSVVRSGHQAPLLVQPCGSIACRLTTWHTAIVMHNINPRSGYLWRHGRHELSGRPRQVTFYIKVQYQTLKRYTIPRFEIYCICLYSPPAVSNLGIGVPFDWSNRAALTSSLFCRLAQRSRRSLRGSMFSKSIGASRAEKGCLGTD